MANHLARSQTFVGKNHMQLPRRLTGNTVQSRNLAGADAIRTESASLIGPPWREFGFGKTSGPFNQQMGWASCNTVVATRAARDEVRLRQSPGRTQRVPLPISGGTKECASGKLHDEDTVEMKQRAS